MLICMASQGSAIRTALSRFSVQGLHSTALQLLPGHFFLSVGELAPSPIPCSRVHVRSAEILTGGWWSKLYCIITPNIFIFSALKEIWHHLELPVCDWELSSLLLADVASPSLELPRAGLDGTWRHLGWWKGAGGGCNRKVPSIPHLCVILWKLLGRQRQKLHGNCAFWHQSWRNWHYYFGAYFSLLLPCFLENRNITGEDITQTTNCTENQFHRMTESLKMEKAHKMNKSNLLLSTSMATKQHCKVSHLIPFF